MPRRMFCVPSAGKPFLDLFSAGRPAPHGSGRFTAAQIEQIQRTVRRAPEVMVKVTGGGQSVGAVRAHVAVSPPLSANELAALKQSVAVLAGVGRLLAQAIRPPSSPGLAREELQRTRAAVAALEQRTHNLARVALISWESRSA